MKIDANWLRAASQVALLALVPALQGCASSGNETAVYVHPSADFSNFRRIAVLPLENLTNERFAAERVREVLNVELCAQGLFDVVEAGEVNRVLRVTNLANPSELGPAELAALGKELGVQALLNGSVLEFEERRIGTISTPNIALSLRLIDVESGLVIWSVSDARAGAKLSTRLFGVGEESQSDATLRLVRQVLSTLE